MHEDSESSDGDDEAEESRGEGGEASGGDEASDADDDALAASDDSEDDDDGDRGGSSRRGRGKPAHKTTALAGVGGKLRRRIARKEIDPSTGEVVESAVEVAAEGSAGALASGGARLDVDADGVHGQASGALLLGAGGKVGIHASQRRYDPETGIGSEQHASVEVGGKAGVWADGGATVEVDEHGAHVRVEGRVAAGAEVDLDADERDELSVGAVHVRTRQHAHAKGFVGAEAAGKAEVELGPLGPTAVVRGEAFAGARGTVSADQRASIELEGLPEVGVFNKNSATGQVGAGAMAVATVGPAGVGVHAGAFAGAKGALKSTSGVTIEGLDIFSVSGQGSGIAGASAEAELGLGAGEDGDIAFGGGVDAALGVGAGAHVQVHINPNNMIKATEIVAHKTLDSLARLPSDPQGALDQMGHNAEALFNGLVGGLFKPQ